MYQCCSQVHVDGARPSSILPGKTIGDFFAQDRSEWGPKKSLSIRSWASLTKAQVANDCEAGDGNKYSAKLKRGSAENFLAEMTGLAAP